ncbi:PAP2 superfamily protein [Nocardioides terrae]|uniref:PAP2 superfamily protein n=1 Tax=Nocardioides terrae TaxID=574651 RepID=A0A1I1IAY0_9ACTN|nr:phosphatase PAP2 family protein [Nocardioides terrae]SFC33357.1 PAP2 superfamily protein [Nocardioides terrae]
MASFPADEPTAVVDVAQRDRADRTRVSRSYGYVGGVWLTVLVFGAVAVVWSQHVGVGFKDPGGRMFVGKFSYSLSALAIALVADLAWRWWRSRSSRGLAATLAARWTPERLLLIVSGLLAYHLVYFSYRNLKSWDAFNTPRDDWLLDVDRQLFGGHSPAVLLHDLLGTHTSAYVLMAVYKSFTYLTATSVVIALAFSRTVRRAYVFLVAAMWTWILGTASYYLIPSLGPFASAPNEFAGLPHTSITDTWAQYLAQRETFLADPTAPGSFVSISAFASLHTGFTALVCFMAFYYGHKWLGTALAVYLVAIMVSTIYWGWHFTLDDLAGLVIGAVAVALGHLIVRPDRP